MNLEEFKQNFKSETTEENQKLKNEIIRLNALICQKDNQISKHQNVCYSLSLGSMCFYCGYNNTCNNSVRHTNEY